MSACPHCGRRIGVVEAVHVSPRDSRAEDPDIVPTDVLRTLGDAAIAMTTAGAAAERAGRAVQSTTRLLAHIEVQRERRRRASATMPAVREWRCIQCGDAVREGMTCDPCVARGRCG